MAEQFDVARELDTLRAARESEVDESFEKEVDGEPITVGSAVGATWGWTKRLPRNIGMGAFRAILNTVETVDNAFETGGQMVANMDANATNTSKASEGKPAVEPIDALPPLQTLFPGVFEAAHQFADSVEANNTISDDITQGIAQFAIPFTGWLKAVGGVHKGATMLNLGRLALAEGVTAASAFEAHEGRMADLVEMGRQMDNKFGEVLQRVSPDGSLANTYINWLTDRENEGEWEGRFKNAVDSVVTTAGIAPFLKGAAVSLRLGKQIVRDVGTKVTPMELQRGSIGVRPGVDNGVKLTSSEQKFFDQIWGSEADRAELLSEVPNVRYENGQLVVPKESEEALMKYVDDTVRLEAGQGNGRLPPSFYRGDFHTKFREEVTPPELKDVPTQKPTDVHFELAESVATMSGRGTTIQVRQNTGGATVGHLEAMQRGNNLQIGNVQLDKELRGRGLSTEIYLDVIQNARKRGFENFISDNEVSEEAVRTWRALERRGFTVQENKNVERLTVERAGEKRRVLQSTDNRPVFTIELNDGVDELLAVRPLRSTPPTE